VHGQLSVDTSGLATVILVDHRGWLLLQERDSEAETAPDRWGLVGGHVERGEGFETAVYRELAEETGIHWSSGLDLSSSHYAALVATAGQ